MRYNICLDLCLKSYTLKFFIVCSIYVCSCSTPSFSSPSCSSPSFSTPANSSHPFPRPTCPNSETKGVHQSISNAGVISVAAATPRGRYETEHVVAHWPTTTSMLHRQAGAITSRWDHLVCLDVRTDSNRRSSGSSRRLEMHESVNTYTFVSTQVLDITYRLLYHTIRQHINSNYKPTNRWLA